MLRLSFIPHPSSFILSVFRYQSSPRTPPSLGTQACHHALTETDGATLRTLPSPSPASMTGWADTGTSQIHWPGAGVTWKGTPLGVTVRPELKSMPCVLPMLLFVPVI